MTLLTRTTLWAFRCLGPPLRISVSVHSVFGMTYARSSNISDYVLSSCFSGARIDLSAEDDVVALALAECPARPYAELIKSDIPGPSSSKSARSAALRPSPPSTMRAFRSQSHQGRAFGSVGDAVSEASECETENPGLR